MGTLEPQKPEPSKKSSVGKTLLWIGVWLVAAVLGFVGFVYLTCSGVLD